MRVNRLAGIFTTSHPCHLSSEIYFTAMRRCVPAALRLCTADKNTANYRPGGGETICSHPPMAVRLTADVRPSADGSAFRTSLVAGGG